MNKINKYLITSVILLGATASVFAEDYKIGVVNPVSLLENSPQAKAMNAQLQKEFDPVQRELVVMQKKLKESEDQLAKDAAIMTEDNKQKLERDIITQRRELKRKSDQATEDLRFRQNEELTKIQKEIIEAIRAVAQRNGYDIVLSEGVVHASSKVNMTQLVIDYLNANAGQ